MCLIKGEKKSTVLQLRHLDSLCDCLGLQALPLGGTYFYAHTIPSSSITSTCTCFTPELLPFQVPAILEADLIVRGFFASSENSPSYPWATLSVSSHFFFSSVAMAKTTRGSVLLQTVLHLLLSSCRYLPSAF